MIPKEAVFALGALSVVSALFGYAFRVVIDDWKEERRNQETYGEDWEDDELQAY